LQVEAVTPTYNEAENLPKLVSALLSLPIQVNLLVVDDNSPDGTGQVADELAAAHPGRVRVLHRSGKLGFSSAYLDGFRLALQGRADAIAQMDADFSHDPQALVEMAARLDSCEVVLGSRYTPGGRVDEHWPFWRKGLSAWGNFYARTILGLPFRDVTTGYRLWRREALAGLPFERIRSSGYIFLVEMAYLAHCLNYRFGEVPIYFADRRWGRSKMSFKIQIEAALRVWHVLWANRDLKRRYRTAQVR
jgi:dolichol-phosphate mannosyltransferase